MLRVEQCAIRCGVILALAVATSTASAGGGQWLVLKGDNMTVGVDKDLTLKVYQEPGDPVWETMESSPPAVDVGVVKPGEKQTPISVVLGEATERATEDFDDGLHKGHRIRLRGLPSTDVEAARHLSR